MFIEKVGDDVMINGIQHSTLNSGNIYCHLISDKKPKGKIIKMKYQVTTKENHAFGLFGKENPNSSKLDFGKSDLNYKNLEVCLFFFNGSIDFCHKDYTKEFEIDDLIVVIFDVKSKNLSLEVNGIHKGIAYENLITSKVYSHVCVFFGNSSIKFLGEEEILDENHFVILKNRKLIDFYAIFK